MQYLLLFLSLGVNWHGGYICSYFGAGSSKSSSTDICITDTEADSDIDHLQANPARSPVLRLVLNSAILNFTHFAVNRVTRNGRKNSLG